MDGGLLSNIPVETCREQFPGYAVVAVDVTSPLWNRQELDNPVRLMDQVVNIGLKKQKAAERALASAVITPDLAGFVNTDFSRIDTMVARGYAATMQRMADIRAAISADTGVSAPGCRSADALALPLRFRGVPPATAAALSAALSEARGPLTGDASRKTALRILGEKGFRHHRHLFSGHGPQGRGTRKRRNATLHRSVHDRHQGRRYHHNACAVQSDFGLVCFGPVQECGSKSGFKRRCRSYRYRKGILARKGGPAVR
jgi:hypothetical protein